MTTQGKSTALFISIIIAIWLSCAIFHNYYDGKIEFVETASGVVEGKIESPSLSCGRNRDCTDLYLKIDNKLTSVTSELYADTHIGETVSIGNREQVHDTAVFATGCIQWIGIAILLVFGLVHLALYIWWACARSNEMTFKEFLDSIE